MSFGRVGIGCGGLERTAERTTFPTDIHSEVERVGDHLASVAVSADFGARCVSDSNDTSVQKLVMMVNVLLDTVACSVDELKRKNQELVAMRTLERTVEEQRDAIAVLSTPLIEVWHGILEVPIVGRLDASRAALLCDALFPALRAKRTSRVILDLTGVTDFEVSAVDGFAEIVRAVRLLGVETFVVGIRPTLAGTLVQLDVRFEGTRVFGTLALALRHCLLETESI